MVGGKGANDRAGCMRGWKGGMRRLGTEVCWDGMEACEPEMHGMEAWEDGREQGGFAGWEGNIRDEEGLESDADGPSEEGLRAHFGGIGGRGSPGTLESEKKRVQMKSHRVDGASETARISF